MPEPVSPRAGEAAWPPAGEEANQIVSDPDGLGDVPRVQLLSLHALKHVQRFAFADADALAVKLYLYNRLPILGGWKRLWPDPESVLGFIEAAGAFDRQEARGTHSSWLRRATRDRAWLTWHRGSAARRWLRSPPRYKLYVSPQPAALGAILPALFADIGDSGAVSFKLGAHAGNLLRPDKIVIYFDEPDALHDYSIGLHGRAAGLAAHGVPFSLPLDGDGLLSWGVDPTPASGADRQGSWRWTICRSAALAMVDVSPTAEFEGWRRAAAWLRDGSIDAQNGGWRVGVCDRTSALDA